MHVVCSTDFTAKSSSTDGRELLVVVVFRCCSVHSINVRATVVVRRACVRPHFAEAVTMASRPQLLLRTTAGARRPTGPLLRDNRDLVLSTVFVTMSLTDGKAKRAIDRTKILQIVASARKAGKGSPVAATFLGNPRSPGHGALVMRGVYTEKPEHTHSGATQPIKCRYKVRQ